MKNCLAIVLSFIFALPSLARQEVVLNCTENSSKEIKCIHNSLSRQENDDPIFNTDGTLYCGILQSGVTIDGINYNANDDCPDKAYAVYRVYDNFITTYCANLFLALCKNSDR